LTRQLPFTHQTTSRINFFSQQAALVKEPFRLPSGVDRPDSQDDSDRLPENINNRTTRRRYDHQTTRRIGLTHRLRQELYFGLTHTEEDFQLLDLKKHQDHEGLQ
jgi:hypothetical protein